MTAEVIGAAALEMAAGREADAVAADGAAAAREPTAWTAPLGVADAGAVAEAEADGAEADRVTADAAEVASDPAAWSAPFGPEVAAAGATEADGAEAARADDGAGAEAGAAATLTGLGVDVVARGCRGAYGVDRGADGVGHAGRRARRRTTAGRSRWRWSRTWPGRPGWSVP